MYQGRKDWKKVKLKEEVRKHVNCKGEKIDVVARNRDSLAYVDFKVNIILLIE